MKHLKKYEDWNSIRQPSHHTEDWFKDYFIESDSELKPGDFVKTVDVDSGVFGKNRMRYHKIVYGIWNGESVKCFTKDQHTVRNPEWIKKVELNTTFGEFINKFWEYAKSELK